MSTPVTLSLLLVLAAFGATTPLVAQDRTAVSGAELDAAVVAQPRGSREVVRQPLTSLAGQQTASRVGSSPVAVSSGVEAVEQVAIDPLTERTLPDTRVLAGGANTIVISTTAIIIGLLLIILLTN